MNEIESLEKRSKFCCFVILLLQYFLFRNTFTFPVIKQFYVYTCLKSLQCYILSMSQKSETIRLTLNKLKVSETRKISPTSKFKIPSIIEKLKSTKLCRNVNKSKTTFIIVKVLKYSIYQSYSVRELLKMGSHTVNEFVWDCGLARSLLPLYSTPHKIIGRSRQSRICLHSTAQIFACLYVRTEEWVFWHASLRCFI